MVLRELNLPEYEGYETDEETTDCSYNYFFLIEGLIKEIGLGFLISERGSGNTFTDALNNAYYKIFYRMKVRYHLFVDCMKSDKHMRLANNNRRKGTGCAFFPKTEIDAMDEFNEHNERDLMFMEDIKIE